MINVPQTTDHLWNRGAPCPYDDVIDVRSPSEFAEDHIPGAVNLPVLSDTERAEVGTIYHQVGAFEARKVGAALVSRNIAHHLTEHFAKKGKDYRPFLYCWRGGMRSNSMATVLAHIGWRVTILGGGYRTYRTHVRQELDTLPQRFTYRLVAGATGSGKTWLLKHLAERGGQVLDLEELANHRGSVLGHCGPQPTQKFFESILLATFEQLDPARPVWLESESHRVGDRYLPNSVWRMMRAAEGIELRVSFQGRVRHLLTEYTHFLTNPEVLKARVRQLSSRLGPWQVEEWEQQIDSEKWEAFVASMLAAHYDPGYSASLRRCFPCVSSMATLEEVNNETLGRLAESLLASEAASVPPAVTGA